MIARLFPPPLLALFFGLATAATAAPIVGPALVRDGDSLVIAGQDIRLYGIDAPELGQTCRDVGGLPWPCGREARIRLERLIAGRAVTCVPQYEDGRGRIVARCRVGATDVQDYLVRAGMALAFTRFSQSFVASEAAARAARVGLWAGTFDAPWEHRAARWRAGEVRAPDGCAIKGNINGAGERIFHPPWSPHYDRVRMEPRDIERGKRWFCSEEEALAAGWRRAGGQGP